MEEHVLGPTGHVPPLKFEVLVDGCELPMKKDTGASRTIVSDCVYKHLA